MTFEGLRVDEQLHVWEQRAHDPRASVPTGFGQLDGKLYRGGLQAGLFCILAGRTHTRKTGTMLNLIANMLRAGTPVGLVGLDEPTPAYVARLVSTCTGADGYSAQWLEEYYDEAEAHDARMTYGKLASQLSLTRGARPTLQTLSGWLEVTEPRPQVVFIDYLQLLARGKYDGNDNTRIPKLAEELAIWTGAEDVVTIALHQVGRESKATGSYYHGDTPLQLESLRSGGEEAADVVLGTYRPALSPLGNMSLDDAQADGFKDEDWQRAQDRVARYERSTMLQLLKNRPSQHGLLLRGVELYAPGPSMFQREYLEQDWDDEVRQYEEDRRKADAS